MCGLIWPGVDQCSCLREPQTKVSRDRVWATGFLDTVPGGTWFTVVKYEEHLSLHC